MQSNLDAAMRKHRQVKIDAIYISTKQTIHEYEAVNMSNFSETLIFALISV